MKLIDIAVAIGITAACIAPIFVAATEAKAGGDPETEIQWAHWNTINNWSIDGSDRGCRMVGWYNSDITLAFTLSTDGNNFNMWVSSPRWTSIFPQGIDYGMDVETERGRWSAVTAHAWVNGGLVVATLNRGAVERIVADNFLRLSINGQQLGVFKLDSSARALVEVAKCTEAMRTGNVDSM